MRPPPARQAFHVREVAGFLPPFREAATPFFTLIREG